MATHRRLLQSLLCLCTLLSPTLSSPIPRATPTSSTFCSKKSSVNQLYNIGADVYIAQGSTNIHKFNVEKGALEPKRTSIHELFGKNKFQWVDTVISLEGFCLKSDLCVDSSWNELERVHLVIGNRKIAGTATYGFALYDLDQTAGTFKQITPTTASESLTMKLAKIGLPLKTNEQEAALMIGEFWPKSAENYYYQSGIFIPERCELIFNVYDDRNHGAQKKLIRRRFTAGLTDEWKVAERENGDASVDFPGMFRYNGKRYAIDMPKSKAVKTAVYEMAWSEADKMLFKRMGFVQEFFNCYQNSTTVAAAASTDGNTVVDKMATAEPAADATSNQETRPATVTPVKEPSTSAAVSTATSTTSTTTSTTTTSKPTEPDVEVFKVDPHAHIEDDSNANKSGEITEEEESSPNALGKGKDDDEEVDSLDSSQSDDPSSHLAGAQLARVNPNDDGLIWTFSILVGVLILLSIIILIPILIIRHNARSDRLYLNKAKKATGTNGNSQNSEEVQLMNSSNIEK